MRPSALLRGVLSPRYAHSSNSRSDGGRCRPGRWLPAVAAIDDVIDGARIFNAKFAGHECGLAQRPASRQRHHNMIILRAVGFLSKFDNGVTPSYTKFLESLGIKVEIFKNSEAAFKAAG